ncbi:MAG: hypothetical protein A4E53_00692 [Pelotomaculum sp. PtaB.Bin104]|nr:MAG: hypothetical protein A4E53_00692 [Pelotomaculum sp. PtaB.Bin104]
MEKLKTGILHQVLMTDLESQAQKQAKIINVNREPGLKSDICVWYVALEPQGSEFEIKGMRDTGEIFVFKKVSLE